VQFLTQHEEGGEAPCENGTYSSGEEEDLITDRAGRLQERLLTGSGTSATRDVDPH